MGKGSIFFSPDIEEKIRNLIEHQLDAPDKALAAFGVVDRGIVHIWEKI